MIHFHVRLVNLVCLNVFVCDSSLCIMCPKSFVGYTLQNIFDMSIFYKLNINRSTLSITFNILLTSYKISLEKLKFVQIKPATPNI